MMKEHLKKNLLLTMMLMLATLAIAACKEKSGSDTQTDTFRTKSGKEITFTAIKHGSIRITFDGREIEVDPVSRLEPATDYSTMPKADYIFVTHEHYDHCDTVAIRQLEKPSNPVMLRMPTVPKSSGKRGSGMHNGDHLRPADDITVDAVPDYNITPGRGKSTPPQRTAIMALFSRSTVSNYISPAILRDVPEMRNIKNIDVAFLSTNQPFTMTPAQTARAAKIIKPKILFPYHYSDTDIQQVANLLKGSGIDVRIRNYK